LSASISCSRRAAELLERIRRGEKPPLARVKALGEECTGQFFRVIVESLADSFDPAEANVYEELMRAWIPSPPPSSVPLVPERVDTIYVLSRVTLGADIKIVSPILAAMRARFPLAHILFVGGRKSAELFASAKKIEFLKAEYPRSGSMADRIAFASQLRQRLATPNSIVIDPDSRMTQLGLIPAAEPGRYFHFPSRTAGGPTGGDDAANLTELLSDWLKKTFGLNGNAWIAPAPVAIEGERPVAALSLGVGENESKRLGLAFESQMIAAIAERFRTLYIDRGMGGEEARRVTEAAECSGVMRQLRFREGSFAEFTSVIQQSDFYAGYDSAGQHAAAAAGTPLITVFAGAPSERFQKRWSPWSPKAHVIDADAAPPEACLKTFRSLLRAL
jgi:ADP-heptose:LPS heptosyltransferase